MNVFQKLVAPREEPRGAAELRGGPTGSSGSRAPGLPGSGAPLPRGFRARVGQEPRGAAGPPLPPPFLPPRPPRMSTRLNCPRQAGAGRVSPSLIVAERNERLTAKRPRTSFKEALDDALEELDTQAEEGQVSSGAYVNIAKRIKAVYDSHSGREEGMKYAVIRMALENARNLAIAPDEVEWPNPEFLDELLVEASKKMHDLDDEDEDWVYDWTEDLIGVYINDGTDPEVFWKIIDMLTSAILHAPLCIALVFSKKFAEILVDQADELNLKELEPLEYSKDREEELTEFWIDKFRQFPSYDFYEFMSTLFDNDSERIESQPTADEQLFRSKLLKKIRRSLKSGCECSICSQLYRKRPNESAAAAREERIAELDAKISALEEIVREESDPEGPPSESDSE